MMCRAELQTGQSIAGNQPASKCRLGLKPAEPCCRAFSRFATGSCGTMAFARRLSQQTAASTAQQLASDQQKMQRWVDQAVAQFEKRCEQASLRAKCSAEMNVQHLHVAKSLQQAPKTTESFTNALQQALEAHGFITLQVFGVGSLGWREGLWCHEYVRVTASWSQAPQDESPCRAGAGCHQAGQIGTCAICNEDRSLVVLAPCGHTLCHLS